MAKKKAAQKELKIVSQVELENGTVLVQYEDGSYAVLAKIAIPAETASSFFGSDEDEDDEDSDEDEDDEDSDEDEDDEDSDEDEDDEDSDEDEDDEDSDEDDDDEEEEEEPLTAEALQEMDFEELEDVCDDKELDTDPDDFDEEDVDKLRKAIAKELGIKLPAAKKGKGKKKK